MGAQRPRSQHPSGRRPTATVMPMCAGADPRDGVIRFRHSVPVGFLADRSSTAASRARESKHMDAERPRPASDSRRSRTRPSGTTDSNYPRRARSVRVATDSECSKPRLVSREGVAARLGVARATTVDTCGWLTGVVDGLLASASRRGGPIGTSGRVVAAAVSARSGSLGIHVTRPEPPFGRPCIWARSSPRTNLGAPSVV
jgi:hypothetical protein